VFMVISDLGWVLRPVIHTASACLTTTEIGLVKNNDRAAHREPVRQNEFRRGTGPRRMGCSTR
jgi:hypothetical protein